MPNNYSMPKKPGDGRKKNPVSRPGRPSQRPSKPTGPSQNRPAGMPLRKPEGMTNMAKKPMPLRKPNPNRQVASKGKPKPSPGYTIVPRPGTNNTFNMYIDPKTKKPKPRPGRRSR